MKNRIGLIGLVAAVGIWTGADLLACGDKFLVVARGTRYQRPKNARAANVLIFASPSSSLSAALATLPVETVLKHEGHRSTRVETPEQLTAILAGGHFDVILASSADAVAVEKLLGASPDAPVLLAFCFKDTATQAKAAKDSTCDLTAPPKERVLLQAIDQAVERHDQNAKKTQTTS